MSVETLFPEIKNLQSLNQDDLPFSYIFPLSAQVYIGNNGDEQLFTERGNIKDEQRHINILRVYLAMVNF